MPTIYIDPWLFLALLLLGVYGVERLFVDLVRWVDGRTRGHKGPTGFRPPKS